MSKFELLIATNNHHKVTEFSRLLKHAPYNLVTPNSIGLELEVEEDGVSFSENAIKKAEAFAKASGLLALADDSGIEVDAMGGRPGIYSARYGGPGLNDKDRVQLLLKELSNVPKIDRGCRYVAVIALASPEGHLKAFEGVCEGQVSLYPQGENGFGYDPIFYIAEKEITMAQATPAVKDQISHRGLATKKALQYFKVL